MTHAVAQVLRVGVRGVFAPHEPALAQVLEHLRPRHSEQRAQQVAAPRPHAGEAGGAGAAQQAQQQRLGLVVLRVRDRDQRGALVVLHAAQERVALAARGLLETALLAKGALAHRRRPAVQRHAERLAEGVTERRVVGRAGPQAVVEVRRHQPEAPAPAQRRERVGERHRVGPAREAHHERVAARGGALERPVDGRDEGRHPHAIGPPRAADWWRCRDSNPGRRGYEPRALTN